MLSGPPKIMGNHDSVYHLDSNFKFTAQVHKEEKQKREAWSKMLLFHPGPSLSSPALKTA